MKDDAASVAKRIRTSTINGRKGKHASPWGKWQPPAIRYPQLNNSTNLREACTYRRPK